MKSKLDPRLKLARSRPALPGLSEVNGWFIVTGPEKRHLQICASDELGWDHVSVTVIVAQANGLPHTREDTVPTWEEMCFVKDLFFEPNEPAFQYHPPESRYKNVHKGCLHLWRKQGEPLPMPPLILV